MGAVVELGLLNRYLNVGRYEVQALIKRVSEFGILEIASVTNLTCTLLTAGQAHDRIILFI